MTGKYRNLWWLGLVLILSLPAAAPLLHQGFFISDDGDWLIIRLSAFFQAFRDGQFPVRFSSRLNHGYGYPVANFLYPGYLYLGSFIHALGFGFVDSVKIILAISLVGSAVFTFLWLRRIFHHIPSLLGSVVYLYLPYHLFDTYVRGSVGEVLALLIVPFFLWTVEIKSVFFSSVSFAFLILSHNILALLFSPFLIIYTLLRAKNSILTFPLGLGLSCFFWLPALYEQKYVIFDKVIVSAWWEYFLTDFTLLGWTTILTICASFILLVKRKRTELLVPYFFLISSFSIFLSFSPSSFIWQFLPLGKLVQFPWRFLSLTLPGLAFLTSYVINNLSGKVFIIFCFLVLSSLGHDAYRQLNKLSFTDKGEQFYATNEATTTVKDEYMPYWVKEKPRNRAAHRVELLGDGELSELRYLSNRVSFTTNVDHETTVKINTIYYPGWKAVVDGQERLIDFDNEMGLIELPVSSGEHHVEVFFRETPFRKLANAVSLLSLAVLLIIFSKRDYLK